MMHYLPGLFALAVAVAGWFYLFYSRAAANLGSVESQRTNVRRVRLRRIGGVAMLLLAVCFYAGFYTVDWDDPGDDFVLVWLAVAVLLVVLVVLALLDLRLTLKLRQQQSDGE